MCGIVGYVGGKDAVEICLKGLKRLEYRGYDSSGIAGLFQSELLFLKRAGKVAALEDAVQGVNLQLDIGISHTRWATHGVPSEKNAHPQLDSGRTLALVHNGIIENHDTIRKMLMSKGVVFQSDTDTEVVAQLIAYLYRGDLLLAFQEALAMVTGAWALALIHKDYPGKIFAAAKECPLVVGVGNGESFIASDPTAFLVHTREVYYLQDSEVAVVSADNLQIFDETTTQVKIQTEMIVRQMEDFSKEGFEHFMLKEIYEHPQVIRNALLSRFLLEDGTARFDELTLSLDDLLHVNRILILACGTSYHAGLIAAYMIEDKARISVQVELSSEFRYRNPVIADNTLVVAISQSGETADTIAAVREVKKKGAKVIAICNVQGSTLTREADSTIFLKAGIEVSVCSTKAFISQLVVLNLFALMMARMRHMSKKEGQEFLHGLMKLPEQIQMILQQDGYINSLAAKYAHYEHFFFLGRHQMYPSALEAALKLKEISYVNANGYAAGEMKHGPIALINELCPTIALCGNKLTWTKMLSNLMEIKARHGLVIAISPWGTEGIEDVANDVIWVPSTIDDLAPIPVSVAGQLFAYYFAKYRGTEIDRPRNLAKSVTVE